MSKRHTSSAFYESGGRYFSRFFHVENTYTPSFLKARENKAAGHSLENHMVIVADGLVGHKVGFVTVLLV